MKQKVIEIAKIIDAEKAYLAGPLSGHEKTDGCDYLAFYVLNDSASGEQQNKALTAVYENGPANLGGYVFTERYLETGQTIFEQFRKKAELVYEA